MASTTWPLQPHEFQPNSFAPYDLVPTSWAQRPPQQHVQYIPEQPAPRIHAPEARRPILNDQIFAAAAAAAASAAPSTSTAIQPRDEEVSPYLLGAKRRTSKLRDIDRKRICQYFLTHSDYKQETIGRLFGVERSTVSKVLKNKDRWLAMAEPPNAPGTFGIGSHRVAPTSATVVSPAMSPTPSSQSSLSSVRSTPAAHFEALDAPAMVYTNSAGSKRPREHVDDGFGVETLRADSCLPPPSIPRRSSASSLHSSPQPRIRQTTSRSLKGRHSSSQLLDQVASKAATPPQPTTLESRDITPTSYTHMIQPTVATAQQLRMNTAVAYDRRASDESLTWDGGAEYGYEHDRRLSGYSPGAFAFPGQSVHKRARSSTSSSFSSASQSYPSSLMSTPSGWDAPTFESAAPSPMFDHGHAQFAPQQQQQQAYYRADVYDADSQPFIGGGDAAEYINVPMASVPEEDMRSMALPRTSIAYTHHLNPTHDSILAKSMNHVRLDSHHSH